MKCDECELLLEYRAEVVAVYNEGGALRAKLVIDDSPAPREYAWAEQNQSQTRNRQDAARFS